MFATSLVGTRPGCCSSVFVGAVGLGAAGAVQPASAPATRRSRVRKGSATRAIEAQPAPAYNAIATKALERSGENRREPSSGLAQPGPVPLQGYLDDAVLPAVL